MAVTRIEENHWQATQGDTVVGGADVSRRPDGRLFLSVDAWHAAVFDRLAATAAADLGGPVHTVVDETDDELVAAWQRAGFTVGRREGEYVLPTDPAVTGLDPDLLPPGIEILPAGQAQEGPLRALDRVVRDEISATVGWHVMPAEVVPLPDGVTVLDPTRYAVATRAGEYLGFVRVAPVPRRPRIGLVAVRADQRGQGLGRALLAHALGALHRAGSASAWAEVHEANPAALALVERAGARRAGGNLELVRP
ncbi:Acetyltransferase (GNAT) family protein [Streptacidiphilus jiangxiensis]|uniref:Acetyltransferase (GNAT) family protein n=2 Tax=Streptacidiphilus jiangxiensis TaxID=235985 RepID=A0A1H7YXK7_STRJI|nr:Acetyltransferase (GNAT) family protein [Streptacidiphilus jiangxiensis]